MLIGRVSTILAEVKEFGIKYSVCGAGYLRNDKRQACRPGAEMGINPRSCMTHTYGLHPGIRSQKHGHLNLKDSKQDN